LISGRSCAVGSHGTFFQRSLFNVRDHLRRERLIAIGDVGKAHIVRGLRERPRSKNPSVIEQVATFSRPPRGIIFGARPMRQRENCDPSARCKQGGAHIAKANAVWPSELGLPLFGVRNHMLPLFHQDAGFAAASSRAKDRQQSVCVTWRTILPASVTTLKCVLQDGSDGSVRYRPFSCHNVPDCLPGMARFIGDNASRVGGVSAGLAKPSLRNSSARRHGGALRFSVGVAITSWFRGGPGRHSASHRPRRLILRQIPRARHGVRPPLSKIPRQSDCASGPFGKMHAGRSVGHGCAANAARTAQVRMSSRPKGGSTPGISENRLHQGRVSAESREGGEGLWPIHPRIRLRVPIGRAAPHRQSLIAGASGSARAFVAKWFIAPSPMPRPDGGMAIRLFGPKTCGRPSTDKATETDRSTLHDDWIVGKPSQADGGFSSELK